MLLLLGFLFYIILKGSCKSGHLVALSKCNSFADLNMHIQMGLFLHISKRKKKNPIISHTKESTAQKVFVFNVE